MRVFRDVEDVVTSIYCNGKWAAAAAGQLSLYAACSDLGHLAPSGAAVAYRNKDIARAVHRQSVLVIEAATDGDPAAEVQRAVVIDDFEDGRVSAVVVVKVARAIDGDA